MALKNKAPDEARCGGYVRMQGDRRTVEGRAPRRGSRILSCTPFSPECAFFSAAGPVEKSRKDARTELCRGDRRRLEKRREEAPCLLSAKRSRGFFVSGLQEYVAEKRPRCTAVLPGRGRACGHAARAAEKFSGQSYFFRIVFIWYHDDTGRYRSRQVQEFLIGGENVDGKIILK